MHKDWNAPTTEKALRRASERAESVMDRNVTLHPDGLSSDRLAVKGYLATLQKCIDDCIPSGVRVVIDQIYPIWLEEMKHEHMLPVSNWLMMTRFEYGDIYDAARLVDKFFEAAYKQDDFTVERYVTNLENFVRSGLVGIGNILERYITIDADTSVLSHALDQRPEMLIAMLDGLDRGFSHTHVQNISPNFYRWSSPKTPQFLDYLLKNHTYADINGILGLVEIKSLPKLTDKWLEQMLAAGFTHKRQVKAYARNLRISYNDPDIYKKVIDVRKRASVTQDAVLSAKNPDIKALSRVILQVL